MQNKGQALVEYILLLVITLILVFSLSAQFIQPLAKFYKNYIGDYISCLLETGELPSPLNPNPIPKCDFDAFKLDNSRQFGSSGPSGNSSNSSSSGSGNNGSNSTSSPSSNSSENSSSRRDSNTRGRSDGDSSSSSNNNNNNNNNDNEVQSERSDSSRGSSSRAAIRPSSSSGGFNDTDSSSVRRIDDPNKETSNTGRNSRFNRRGGSQSNQDISFEQETIIGSEKSGFAGRRVFTLDSKNNKSDPSNIISSGTTRISSGVQGESPRRGQFKVAASTTSKQPQFEDEGALNFGLMTYLKYGIILLILIGLGFMMFTQLRTINKEL